MSNTVPRATSIASGAGGDVLYVRTGPRAPYVVRWHHDHPFTIGRFPDNALALVDDAQVSRRHAETRFVGGHAVLPDPGSPNGTRVNGSPVVAPTRLAPGDRIQVGSSEIVFNPSPAIDDMEAWLAEDPDAPASGGTALRIPLPANGALILGRAPEQGVALPDESLADSQASVQAFYGDYVLADLAGSGSTLVNGAPLAGPARLEVGDEVQLGSVRLRFA